MGGEKGRRAMHSSDDPPVLRRAVEEAARLRDELLVDEQLASFYGEWQRAWIVGRADEIARFVEDVRASWRHRRKDEASAAAALQAYLAALHEGLEKNRRGGSPTWCPGLDDTTANEEDTLRTTVDALLLDLSRRVE